MRWERTWTLVEAHAAGSVAKVLTGGIVDVPGATMLDKMQWLRQHDTLRRLLLHEPRGAPGTSLNVLLPSSNPRADLGFVIMEGSEYVAMSGSNTIGTATVILETGIVPMIEPETRLVLHESILDMHFTGVVTGTTTVGGRRGIRSSIEGSAWITGIIQYGYDPTDPFPEGFTLADTWLAEV